MAETGRACEDDAEFTEDMAVKKPHPSKRRASEANKTSKINCVPGYFERLIVCRAKRAPSL